MCGVLGIFQYQFLPYQQAPFQQQIINSLTAMKHRGPDATGICYSNNGQQILGHRRLAITDHEKGDQPISNENGTLHIVVNGAFYNYKNLRHELESLGHRFKTDNDSEVALHLYEQYGLNFIEHLVGEFALIIADETMNKMIAVRDRYGIKPLHFSKTEQSLFIASEAKALFELGIEPKWDTEVLAFAFSMQYLPPDRSHFKHIQQLKPGHLLIADDKGMSIRQYWNSPPVISPENSFEQTCDTILTLLKRAIAERMQTDLPIACHLSGGIDSAIIAAVSQQILSQATFSQGAFPQHRCSDKLDTFTVSYANSQYDEAEQARMIADYIGAENHTIRLTSLDLLNAMEQATYYSETLSINGHLAAKFLLNKSIHEAGYKLVLGGEGADEIFAGYPHLKEDLNLPLATDDIASGVMIANDQGDIESINRLLGYTPAFLKAKYALGKRISYCLQDVPERDYPLHFVQAFNTHRDSGVLEKSLSLWTRSALANYILKGIGDGTEMAHSLEGRLPFLDHRLSEFVHGLPGEYKLHVTQNTMINKEQASKEKYCLRESIKGLLPESVRMRTKQAFIAPPLCDMTDRWAKEFLYDWLGSSFIKDIPYINQTACLALLDEMHTMTKAQLIKWDPVILTLVSAMMLHKQFKLS